MIGRRPQVLLSSGAYQPRCDVTGLPAIRHIMQFLFSAMQHAMLLVYCSMLHFSVLVLKYSKMASSTSQILIPFCLFRYCLRLEHLGAWTERQADAWKADWTSQSQSLALRARDCERFGMWDFGGLGSWLRSSRRFRVPRFRGSRAPFERSLLQCGPWCLGTKGWPSLRELAIWSSQGLGLGVFRHEIGNLYPKPRLVRWAPQVAATRPAKPGFGGNALGSLEAPALPPRDSQYRLWHRTRGICNLHYDRGGRGGVRRHFEGRFSW